MENIDAKVLLEIQKKRQGKAKQADTKPSVSAAAPTTHRAHPLKGVSQTYPLKVKP